MNNTIKREAYIKRREEENSKCAAKLKEILNISSAKEMRSSLLRTYMGYSQYLVSDPDIVPTKEDGFDLQSLGYIIEILDTDD